MVPSKKTRVATEFNPVRIWSPAATRSPAVAARHVPSSAAISTWPRTFSRTAALALCIKPPKAQAQRASATTRTAARPPAKRNCGRRGSDMEGKKPRCSLWRSREAGARRAARSRTAASTCCSPSRAAAGFATGFGAERTAAAIHSSGSSSGSCADISAARRSGGSPASSRSRNCCKISSRLFMNHLPLR